MASAEPEPGASPSVPPPPSAPRPQPTVLFDTLLLEPLALFNGEAYCQSLSVLVNVTTSHISLNASSSAGGGLLAQSCIRTPSIAEAARVAGALHGATTTTPPRSRRP